jgi:hypothetical protein
LTDNRTQLDYQLYAECIEVLVCLFSSQSEREPVNHFRNDLFLDLLIDHMKDHSNRLAERLLKNYIEHLPEPAPSVGNGLIMSAYTMLVGKSVAHSDSFSVSDNSLVLLILIASQGMCQVVRSLGVNNHFQSSIMIESVEDSISFRLLYNRIGKKIGEETVFLLYLLMTRNNHFRIYFLSRTDPETMVNYFYLIKILGLLKLAYEASEDHHAVEILMLILDIFVIISLDDAYILNLQKISITSPSWYTERKLRNVSLGGVLSLLIMRILNYNFSKIHNVHIHIGSIAVLSNMATAMFDIETVVAQRLLTLLEQASKKYFKLFETWENAVDNMEVSDSMVTCSDVVATILEFINAIITSCLKNNSHLTYALLEKVELIVQYQEYCRFAPLVKNISNVNSSDF